MSILTERRYDGTTEDFYSHALLTSKTPWDTTGQTNVDGFVITGNEPPDTLRRFMFKIDGNLYKFVGTTLTPHSGAGDCEDVLTNGNTAEELGALEEAPALIGKRIYPVIALYAAADAAAYPTVKIGLKVRSDTTVYSKTVDSAEIELPTEGSGVVPRIADITARTTVTGNGAATVTARFKDEEGDWSEFLPLTEAANRECVAVQLRLSYRVTTLDGTDSARVDSVTIRHNMGASLVSGNFAQLYTVVQNYEADLQTCYIVVRHKKLIDSQLNAYVNFTNPPKIRELIFLGEGTGALAQFALGVDGVKDTGIDQNTLRVFVDGDPLDDFGYNVEVSEVTVNAPEGSAITASYEYEHGSENWLPMTKMDSQPYLDDAETYMTRFNYTLPDDETADQQISNVRLELYRTAGTVTAESLGNATGLYQQIKLPHAAKQETIQLNASWSYDVDTQILSFVAAKDTALVLSYDWIGEQQEIYSWAVGWAAAV